jgi:hypothetical protein
MRWPFRTKREETDLRIFRDPKSGEMMLRLQGDVGWPTTWERDAIIQLNVNLSTRITESAARQLRDQINALLPEKLE